MNQIAIKKRDWNINPFSPIKNVYKKYIQPEIERFLVSWLLCFAAILLFGVALVLFQNERTAIYAVWTGFLGMYLLVLSHEFEERRSEPVWLRLLWVFAQLIVSCALIGFVVFAAGGLYLYFR